jgi:tRNA(Ile2) C34 agmatinyltransferase TiaS
MSIIYCSECDKYKESDSDCDYPCKECGETMIELSEEDLLIKIEEMQQIIYEW